MKELPYPHDVVKITDHEALCITRITFSQQVNRPGFPECWVELDIKDKGLFFKEINIKEGWADCFMNFQSVKPNADGWHCTWSGSEQSFILRGRFEVFYDEDECIEQYDPQPTV